MLGGVTVNFILAVLIYIGMAYAYGETYISNSEVKDGIMVSNPVGEKVGFRTGDKILAVDGKTYDHFDDAAYAVLFSKKVTIERDGKTQTLDLPVDLLSSVMEGRKEPLYTLRVPFIVGKMTDTSPNVKLLERGDMITSINGQPMKYHDQVVEFGKKHVGQTLTATVFRDEKQQPASVAFDKSGKMGIYPAQILPDNLERLGYYKISRDEYTLAESFPAGIRTSGEQLNKYFSQLKAIFNPSTGAYKGVGGFYAIFDIFPNNWSWASFWSITALLSIMLGVMNLLPIPALDGGHVMFLLYEMITRRKPSDKFMEYAQMAGFFLLIALLLFANGNDIYKAIIGK
jgi:regulator of sigma E protease